MTTLPRRGAARAGAALASTLLAASTLSACGVFGSPDLVIYNAQHEQLLDEIIPAFEKQTGINVKLRNGDDLQLANQLVQEGDKSPADVFLTENSPAMSLVDQAGLFAKIDAKTQALIPAAYRPADNDWIGFLAGMGNYLRAEVLFDAGLHPSQRPRDLDAVQTARLAG